MFGFSPVRPVAESKRALLTAATASIFPTLIAVAKIAESFFLLNMVARDTPKDWAIHAKFNPNPLNLLISDNVFLSLKSFFYRPRFA